MGFIYNLDREDDSRIFLKDFTTGKVYEEANTPEGRAKLEARAERLRLLYHSTAFMSKDEFKRFQDEKKRRGGSIF